MKIKNIKILTLLCLSTIVSCAQKSDTNKQEKIIPPKNLVELPTPTPKPHQYGGWFCPDNLHGFPPVNIKDWRKVPVVNGRMATKEETQTGISLINVDMEKYPNAKPLDIVLPKLATYYNTYTNKEDFVIIIQALNISNDSIVGFRYLNGGNGSARLSEVNILTNKEADAIKPSYFVTHTIEINKNQKEIWDVLTSVKYSEELRTIFDAEMKLNDNWHKNAKVNFKYFKNAKTTSEYADILFGNHYIQIDYDINEYKYVEKFFLSNNKTTKKTKLEIVCGPYYNDYEHQKSIIHNWANKVKELSEKN